MDVLDFWNCVAKQDKVALRYFFTESAVIRWHATNEQFNVSEYIQANCEYPGNWTGVIKQVKKQDNQIITITNVTNSDTKEAYLAVSFLTIIDGLISELDEYWSDMTQAPKWRRDMGIGKPIH
ncbi:hypothetical protein AOC36_00180 [Erysipelothrix larvae]|uniref:SnoaL-like domain-containing protein n=1 Tax=Erysipelothrix larvae TaxID=1514105 RepID=A0A0X8H1W5_9FIRM|nr:hypothetical protein AOC36_00180 [Erysipelothrix larvae]